MEKTAVARTICSFFCITACLCFANGITLFDQSKSFAIYEAWNVSLFGNLRLRFKTQCQYCLIIYLDDSLSTYEAEPTGAADRARRAGKRGNYLQVAMVLGSLHLEQQISYEEETLTQSVQVGDQLNDLEWHELTIRKYENKITVAVDGSSAELLAPKLLADKFSVNSYLFIGGLSRVKESSAYGKAKFIPRFVGCIEDISYSSGRATSKTSESFVKGERITLACLNSCLSNPCLNGGRCVNLFTRAGCDCFGTGFGGDRCSIAAQSVHTYGNGSLQWKHTRDNADEPASIRIRFKAIRSEGTLLYQKSSSCELAVRLLEGSLTISAASSEKGTVSRTVRGVDFLDGKWHTVEVNHRSNNISLIADRRHIVWLTPSIVASPELSFNDILVLFGGLPRNSETEQTSGSGFHGCLQQLSYNQVDLVYKLYHTVDSRLSKLGEIRQGCSLNETHVPLNTHIEVSAGPAARPTLSQVPIQNVNQNLEGSDLHLRDDRGIGQGVIVWITAAIVIGTIIIMISAACVVHHIRLKYSENVSTTVLKSGEETVQLNVDRVLQFSGQEVSVRRKECAFTPKIFGKNTEVSVKFLRQEEQQTVL